MAVSPVAAVERKCTCCTCCSSSCTCCCCCCSCCSKQLSFVGKAAGMQLSSQLSRTVAVGTVVSYPLRRSLVAALLYKGLQKEAAVPEPTVPATVQMGSKGSWGRVGPPSAKMGSKPSGKLSIKLDDEIPTSDLDQ